MQSKIEMVQMGKSIQVQKDKIMKEREDLSKRRQQEIMDLKHDTDEKKKNLENRYEKRLQREKIEMENIIKEVQMRQEQIELEKEEIEEFMKIAEKDKNEIMQGEITQSSPSTY